MWGRVLTGCAALGLYGWRVEDPKGSYAAFYDASDWLTSWLVAGEGAWGYARNFANLILVDQADGFLLGMAFMALISLIIWPFRAAGGWAGRRLRDAMTSRTAAGGASDAAPPVVPDAQASALVPVEPDEPPRASGHRPRKLAVKLRR